MDLNPAYIQLAILIVVIGAGLSILEALSRISKELAEIRSRVDQLGLHDLSHTLLGISYSTSETAGHSEDLAATVQKIREELVEITGEFDVLRRHFTGESKAEWERRVGEYVRQLESRSWEAQKTKPQE